MGSVALPHTDCVADELADYLAGLTITQGHGVGLPMFIMPWEAKFVAGTFKPDVLTAALTLGRNNGKTGLCGALGAAAVTGPLAQPRAEVALIAASFKQARLLFGHAKAFLQPEWERHPRDWRISDTSNLARLEHRPSPDRDLLVAHAANVRDHCTAWPLALALLDEPDQVGDEADADKMVSAIVTGHGEAIGREGDRARDLPNE